MAVPKKRTSKSKSRKFIWLNKALDTTKKSWSLARSIISNKSTNFIYNGSLQNEK